MSDIIFNNTCFYSLKTKHGFEFEYYINILKNLSFMYRAKISLSEQYFTFILQFIVIVIFDYMVYRKSYEKTYFDLNISKIFNFKKCFELFSNRSS